MTNVLLLIVSSYPVCQFSVRHLGLHIDENLLWYQHKANVIQRVYSRIHCLNCLHPLPADLLAKLYCIFVISILDYCDVVWIPSPVQHFKRLHLKFNSQSSSSDLSLLGYDSDRMKLVSCSTNSIECYLRKLSPLYLNNTFYYAVDITLHTG